MPLVRVDLESIAITNAALAFIVLKPRHEVEFSNMKLPIAIGRYEASALTVAVNGGSRRPSPHMLMKSIIETVNGDLINVIINKVDGPVFSASLSLLNSSGEINQIDARPSDAIPLAILSHTPIFCEESVLLTAGVTDFESIDNEVQEKEIQEFKDFLDTVSPADFESLLEQDNTQTYASQAHDEKSREDTTGEKDSLESQNPKVDPEFDNKNTDPSSETDSEENNSDTSKNDES